MEPWPADELEAVPACPVCGGTGRSPLHEGLTDRVFGTAPGTWDLARCTSCGSAFLDPRPTEDSVGRAYEGAYATHAPPLGEPPAEGPVAVARRALRNGYLRRLGYDLRPASPLGAAVSLVPTMRAVTDRDFRHLVRPHPGARLLDVGCGNGAFVVRMREAGWNAAGQEIDPEASAFAHAAGAPVTGEPVEALARREPGVYHAITISHVVEHVHRLQEFLAALRDLLVAGGTLWVATPNLASAGHERYGRDWMALDPPRHLVLFNPGSLRRALEAAGFRDVRFPLPWSGGGGIHRSSEAIARGERPRMVKGPLLPDLVSLVRRERAEELVALATRG